MAAKIRRYIVVPDIHVPYHDPSFIALITAAIKIIRPNGLVQLGDALDFWQVSSYDKNPLRKQTMMEDVQIYSKILDEWEQALPRNAEIIQLEGNHEDRLRRYIWKHAKELADGWVRTVPEMLNLRKRRIKCSWHEIANYQSCKIGDCILHHGHYFNEHVAVGNLKRYPKSIITGHTHRFQMADSGERFSASLGHGSNEHQTAHQPTPTGWKQAFGILTVVNGKSSLEPILVHKGQCVLYGKVLKR
jgi:UDP-2,3-diacylglucosamine pyrophosphatase LpxH